jgi:anti-sigma regulatory factor (Ser/Thr protein kinase)
MLEELNVEQDCIDEIALALGELISNAIVHGSNSDEKFNVEVECLDATVRLVVQDTGTGFTLDELPVTQPLDFLAGLDLPVVVTETAIEGDEGAFRLGGMGIFNVRQVMDEVCYERISPCGTRVTAIKKIRYQENVQTV